MRAFRPHRTAPPQVVHAYATRLGVSLQGLCGELGLDEACRPRPYPDPTFSTDIATVTCAKCLAALAARSAKE